MSASERHGGDKAVVSPSGVGRLDGKIADLWGCNAALTGLPDDLKARIRTTFLDAAKNDKAAFDRLSDGKNRPWQPVGNAAYDDTIKLIVFVDRLRKRAG